MNTIKIGVIGDIVGSPAREIIKNNLISIKEKYNLNLVIANAENASGGFGLSVKNAHELFSFGIDVITGGNHSFDKQEIITLMDTFPILRPINLLESTPGNGIYINNNIAVINAIGHYGININSNNVFRILENEVNNLNARGIKNIIIDFHAESSSEKRIAFSLLQGKISALLGTHTHIGSDDLQIYNGSFYVSDIGLSGSYDNIIGMDNMAPTQRALFGFSKSRFSVVNTDNTILQMIIITLENGRCMEAFKIKILNDVELSTIYAVKLFTK